MFQSRLHSQFHLRHISTIPRHARHRTTPHIVAESTPEGGAGSNMPWHAPSPRKQQQHSLDKAATAPKLEAKPTIQQIASPPPASSATKEPTFHIQPQPPHQQQQQQQQQAEKLKPKARDLVGYQAVKYHPTKQSRRKPQVIGIVEKVLAVTDTGAAHPLLKVVKNTENQTPLQFQNQNITATVNDKNNEALLEEHLIPLVKSIVPRIDPVSQTIYVDAPEGLLDLGRRRVLINCIRYDSGIFLFFLKPALEVYLYPFIIQFPTLHKLDKINLCTFNK